MSQPERGRCPICFRQFALSALPAHAEACLDSSSSSTATAPHPRPPAQPSAPAQQPQPLPEVSIIDEQVAFLQRAAARREQEERDRQLALAFAANAQVLDPPAAAATTTPVPPPVAAVAPGVTRDSILREQRVERVRLGELERWYDELLRLPACDAVREQLQQVRRELETLSRNEALRTAQLEQLDMREALDMQSAAERTARDAALARQLAAQERQNTVGALPRDAPTFDYSQYQLVENLPSRLFSPPANWRRGYRGVPEIGVFSLKTRSPEWLELVNSRGLPFYHVRAVRRIQLPDDWHNYARQRAMVAITNGTPVPDHVPDYLVASTLDALTVGANECWVWLDVSERTRNTTLASGGINMRAHANYTYFRDGIQQRAICTTTSLRKAIRGNSDQEHQPTRELVLCRAVLGNVASLQAMPLSTYDSLENNDNLLILDETSIYPQYLVCIDRTYQ